MGLMLTRFGQEVDVATGSLDVAYFAVFRTSDGRELKLPISEEASRTLIGFFADAKPQQEKVSGITLQGPTEEMVTEDLLQQAKVFGDEEDEEEQDGSDDDDYDSEEAVPSL
jgi:ATP phosphoribosyltransferase regulatory subunit HisZ